MPKDTVRELRINLISVKDHSKYFSGGEWGWAAALAGKEVRVPGAPLGLALGRHSVAQAGGVSGHPVPGQAASDRAWCFAA